MRKKKEILFFFWDNDAQDIKKKKKKTSLPKNILQLNCIVVRKQIYRNLDDLDVDVTMCCKCKRKCKYPNKVGQ